MARKALFEHQGYRLGRVGKTAFAIWGTGKDRASLGVPYGPPNRPSAEAKQALVTYVARVQKLVDIEQGITIGALWGEYIALKEAEGVQIEPYATVWKSLRHTFAEMDPSHISEKLCQEYCVASQKAGKSRWTIWTRMNRLRTVLNWAVKSKRIKEYGPLWMPKAGDPRDDHLSVAEIDRLIEASTQTPHLYLFTLIAALSGARTAAILELTWDRVDFQRGEVDLRADTGKSEDDILRKGHKKGRSKFEMGPLLRAALTEAKAMAETSYVIEYHGARVKSVKKSFAKAVKRAGLDPEKVSPHVLRHTVVTTLADAGTPIEQVSRLLGHSDTAITERVYNARTAKQTSGAVAAMENNIISLQAKRTKAA